MTNKEYRKQELKRKIDQLDALQLAYLYFYLSFVIARRWVIDIPKRWALWMAGHE